MTRTELYKAMEHEKIIMYDEFLARLNRTPLLELVTRWAGVLELAKAHEIRKRRPDWLAMTMWNSTSLTVGEDELARRAEERRKEAARREEAERKRREQEINDKLSAKKMAYWKQLSSAERRKMIEDYLPQANDFFREYVTENYLKVLDTMSERMVLLWFWSAIPPFTLEELEIPVPLAEAA